MARKFLKLIYSDNSKDARSLDASGNVEFDVPPGKQVVRIVVAEPDPSASIGDALAAALDVGQ